MDEREQLIKEIFDRDKAMLHATQGDIIPDWLNVDLTMPQLKITLLLYWRNRMRMGDLATILQKNISTATGIIDRLVEHKLVKREEDPEDRRVVVVSITAEGRQLCDALWQNNRDRFAKILSRLSTDELKIVAQAMNILHKTGLLCQPEKQTNE